jgi:serine/threonine protein kinase
MSVAQSRADIRIAEQVFHAHDVHTGSCEPGCERVAEYVPCHFPEPQCPEPHTCADCDSSWQFAATFDISKALRQLTTVYRAQQLQPIRRDVALKIIKPGMDSRKVIARFETERQALALMDHPNIARVFDAGANSNGRPDFVVEIRFPREQKHWSGPTVDRVVTGWLKFLCHRQLLRRQRS